MQCCIEEKNQKLGKTVNIHILRHTDNLKCFTRIGGVMVIVLVSSTVDRGFEPRSGLTKDYEMVFVVSPLSMQH